MGFKAQALPKLEVTGLHSTPETGMLWCLCRRRAERFGTVVHGTWARRGAPAV